MSSLVPRLPPSFPSLALHMENDEKRDGARIAPTDNMWSKSDDAKMRHRCLNGKRIIVISIAFLTDLINCPCM